LVGERVYKITTTSTITTTTTTVTTTTTTQDPLDLRTLNSWPIIGCVMCPIYRGIVEYFDLILC